MDLCRPQGGKGGHTEEEEYGTFWRGTTIDSDTRLRVGRAIAKTEEEVAAELMEQLQERGHPEAPPGIATDGKGAYREAMVETWGQVPEYSGHGRPPTIKREQEGWQYVQVIKHREGRKLVDVSIKVIYGDPDKVIQEVGAHTAYVERTNLTSRHMNGRLVRKTLTFSKELCYLEASCAWEDWVYNLTRTVKTLRQKGNTEQQKWEQRSPAMAAKLTDHVWTVKELLTTVVVPRQR